MKSDKIADALSHTGSTCHRCIGVRIVWKGPGRRSSTIIRVLPAGTCHAANPVRISVSSDLFTQKFISWRRYYFKIIIIFDKFEIILSFDSKKGYNKTIDTDRNSMDQGPVCLLGVLAGDIRTGILLPCTGLVKTMVPSWVRVSLGSPKRCKGPLWVFSSLMKTEKVRRSDTNSEIAY